jgi:hypothetical protein
LIYLYYQNAIHANDVGNYNASDYTIYATYDQGSLKLLPGKSLSIQEVLIRYLEDYGGPITLILFGTAVIILTLLFRRILTTAFKWHLYLLRNLFSKRKVDLAQSIFEGFDYYSGIAYKVDLSVSSIIRDLMNTRKYLKNDILSKEVFPDEWKAQMYSVDIKDVKKELSTSVIKRKQKIERARKKIIKNVNDYLLIDDFFTRLNSRNRIVMDHVYGQAPLNNEALAKINKECYELTDEALKKIDWSKYGGYV